MIQLQSLSVMGAGVVGDLEDAIWADEPDCDALKRTCHPRRAELTFAGLGRSDPKLLCSLQKEASHFGGGTEEGAPKKRPLGGH